MGIFSKVMTFEKAKKKLQKIANGRFNTIDYKYRTSCKETDFNVEVQCQLYIDGYPHVSAPTWADAFDNLDKMINPKKTVIDLKEQPGGLS